MNMKRTIGMVMTMSVGFAFAADVTYTEPPADTAMIKVAGGTTTVAGLEAYSHLTHYWSFDDAENYLTDSTGTLTFGKQPATTTITHETAEGAKLGAGAVTVDAGLQVPKNVITSQTFTVAFWLKPNTKTKVGSQGSIFYVGEKGSETAKRLLLSYGNDNGTMFFWNTGKTRASSIAHTTESGIWEHWAITRNSANKVTVYLNGTSMTSTTYDNVFGEDDYLIFGNGWYYGGTLKSIGGGTFDEILIFDRDLTVDEINAFAASSLPVDFSAGWNIMVDGTLDIFGRKPLTALKGEGVAKTMETTRLEATSNAWFAGSVQSPAFTFAGESSVTQTLSGANAWTGATTVESGTLEIAASPVEVFGDALVAWYPFEDPSDPGRDFSPRGNHLKKQSDFVYECTESNAPFAGAGRVLSVKGNTEVRYLYSSGMLNGFVSGQDNSFTVSFWLRTDSWNKNEGPFQFATSPATGIWAYSNTSLRAGDTGNMFSPSMKWGDEVWHHWALVYDAAAAAKGETCYSLFIDGKCKSSAANHKEVLHATAALHIGRSLSASAKPLDGAMDEFIVLNTCNTDDVAKLYALRRTQPETATGVLPTGTTLTVEEGATLKLTAANETVKRLSGKGTIDLSGNSKLTVTRRSTFEGKVIGGEITDEHPGAIIIVR